MNNENETILEETNDKRVTTTELLKFSDRYGTDEDINTNPNTRVG